MGGKRKRGGGCSNWMAEHEANQDAKSDQYYNDQQNFFLTILKEALNSKEEEIIESIIINCQKDSWDFSLDCRRDAIIDFKNNELIDYTESCDIPPVNLNIARDDYIIYLKNKILLDLPEENIESLVATYNRFLHQKDEPEKAKIIKTLTKWEDISDIDVFIIAIKCDERWKPWLKNLLTIIKSVNLKEHQKFIEEMAQVKLIMTLDEPTKQDKLNFKEYLWKDVLDGFKKLINKQKEEWQFFSIFDMISDFVEYINKYHNYRFTEKEKSMLNEIWQNYLKRIINR